MIPVYKPFLDSRERKLLLSAFDSGWISSKGEYVTRFEDNFVKYTKIKHATTVANGTVALHLALLALNLKPGSEIIVPNFAYVAVSNACRYMNLTPVYSESDEENWNLDPKSVIKCINKNTAAIIFVHSYGIMDGIDEISKIARENKLYLIEDCAEAIGSWSEDKSAGSYADISTFSFFGNKTITTGEGGMVCSNNKDLIDKVKHLKNQGVSKEIQYYHDIVGYNYRMTNICAAIGCAQLSKIEEIIKRKKEIQTIYKNSFDKYKIAYQKSTNHDCFYWMFSIKFDNKIEADKIRLNLANKGVETRPGFFANNKLNFPGRGGVKLETSEKLSETVVTLPSYPELTNDEINYVIDAIIEGV